MGVVIRWWVQGGLWRSSPSCQHHRLLPAPSHPQPKGAAVPKGMPLSRSGPHRMAGRYKEGRPSPPCKFGTTRKRIPLPQFPIGSAETFITTALQFTVTFCPLPSLPHKSCSQEPILTTLCTKISI